MPTTSIRRRLLRSFLFLATVPLLLAGMFLGWQSYQRNLQEAHDRQQETAKRVAAQAESYMARIQQELENAIAYTRFASASNAERRATLETLLSKRELYRELLFVDTKGEEQIHLSNSRALVPGHPQSESNQYEELVAKALRSDQFTRSSVFYDRTSNEPLLLIAAPFHRVRDGRQAGLIVAEIRLYPIWKLISDLRFPDGEDVYVIGTTGRVVAHQNSSVVLRETHLKLMGTSLGRQDGLKGQDVVLSVERFEFGQRDFLVVAEKTIRSIWRIVLNDVLIIAGVILAALLGAFVLGAQQAGRISRPIISVSQAARAIRDGDLAYRVSEGGDDEIGEMAKTFNSMAGNLQKTLQQLEDEVTVRSHAEAELQKHQARLEELVAERTRELSHQQAFNEAVLDNVSDGIVACDADGRVSLFNSAAREMFGIEAGKLSDEYRASRYSLYAKDGQTLLKKDEIPLFRAYAGERFVNQEFAIRRVDGHSMVFESSGQPMFDQDRRKIGAVVSMRDISARKAAAEAMIAAKLAAEEASQAKSNFVANMSHELRTPLNAILGMVYLALRSDLPAVVRSQLSKAQGAAHSLLGIINDVLDISKIEAGKLEVEHVEFSLDSVLERVTDVIGNQASQKNIEFLIRYDAQIPSLLVGDPLRFGQVLLNLCSNAVKFTEHGEVELSFHVQERSQTEITVRLCVKDTGIGMPVEVQERLFDKFVQADQSTTRRFGGTGLGLSICRELVDLMGGRIWVEASRPGVGSTICFTLALGIAPTAQVDHVQNVVTQAGTLLKDLRTLVVDDNKASCEILAEMLRDFHIQADIRHSGAEALSALQSATAAGHPYDLALIDWNMPEMSGTQTIQRLRRDPDIEQKIKIIMVTAHGREDVFSKADLQEPDGFIVKPVSPSMLLDTILSALGRARVLARDRGHASVRDWHYDFSGMHVLLVEDNDINREFAGVLLRSENIEVDEAVNGQEAVEAVQKRSYDAVLMDVQMPVMDGLEATRAIRALAYDTGDVRYAKLPIIAMTALAMTHDMERSLAAGMNAHVTKPIEPDQLMMTLGKWGSRPERKDAVKQKARGEDFPLDLLNLKHIDTRKGVRRMGDRVDAYRRQLQRFAEHYASAIPELQRLLNDEGVQEAENYCHALKGVTGNIGAMALNEKVTEVDDLLKQGNIPPAEAWLSLDGLLQEVLADIASVAEVAQPTTGPQAVLVDEKALQTLLQQLLDVLDADLGQAEHLMGRIRSGANGGPWQTSLDELARKIDAFDIEAAKTLAESLLSQLGSAAQSQ